MPSPAKGPTAHLTNDRDPESDSGLPDRSSEPNQQPQADTAGGAMESTVTVSSSPPPALLRRRDSPSSPRLSRIPVREPGAPLDSPSRDLHMERRHRWSSPVPGSPTHSPSPSLSCDNLPCALPRDRLSSEREDPLSLSYSSGSKSKIPRPVSATFVPEQLTSRFLPRPPPGKPPIRPCVDNRYELFFSGGVNTDILISVFLLDGRYLKLKFIGFLPWLIWLLLEQILCQKYRRTIVQSDLPLFNYMSSIDGKAIAEEMLNMHKNIIIYYTVAIIIMFSCVLFSPDGGG